MATRVLLVLAATANAVFALAYPAKSEPQSLDDRVVHLAIIYCSTREPCEQALAEIKKGERFENVARRYSEDANSRVGGDAGLLPIANLAPALQAALRSQDLGTITRIVEQRGFLILRIIENLSQSETDRREEDLRQATKKSQAAWARVKDLVREGQSLRKAEDYAEATKSLEKALETTEELYGEDSVEWSYVVNEAYLAIEPKGPWEEGRDLLQRALAIRENHLGPNHPRTATSLSNLAEVNYQLGEYSTALPLLERALAIEEHQHPPSHLTVAMRLTKLGFLLKAMADYSSAQPLLERALAIRENQLGTNHPDTAVSLTGLAMLLKDKGDYAGARTLHERALTIWETERGSESPETAIALGNLAVSLHHMGDYAAAKLIHERTLAIREKQFGINHHITAVSLGALAWLLHDLGDYSAARPLYERALAIREEQLGSEHLYTAASLNGLAWLFYDMGNYASAKPLYQRALDIREKQLGSEHPETAQSTNNLALLLEHTGNHAAAKSHYERALAIYEKHLGSDHPRTANTFFNLAWFVMNTGEGSRKQARLWFDRAAMVFRKSGTTARVWAPLAGAGQLMERERHWPEAIEYYREAITAFEETRSSLDTEKTQTSFMRDKLWVYKALQGVLHRIHEKNPKAGHDHEMFSVAEQGRARALLELLGEARGQLRQQAPSDWQVRYTAAMAEFNGAHKTLGTNLPDADRQAQLRRLRDAEAQMDRLDAELHRFAPALASVEAPQPVQVVTLQREVLRNGEVVLAYSLGEEKSFLYLVSQQQFKVVELPPESEIQELVTRLGLAGTGNRGIGGIGPRKSGASPVKRLHDVLIGSATDFIPSDSRLIIVPDGVLFYLPFELLGEILEKHAISYQPSASVLAFSRQHGAASQATGALLAMAPFAAESVAVTASPNLTLFSRDDWTKPEPLPFTRTELEGIRGLYEQERVSLKFGPEAQEAVLKSPDASEFRRLHLATHAFVNPQAPRRSAVILSQENLGEDEDGLLTLNELFGLKLDADLVVLSACETGLGKLEKGEGMIGLTRGFLYAGARSLVVSLWKVSDQATAIFMERFYRNMREKGMSKAEALQQAKLSFINEEEMPILRDPFYWAPFILVGDAD